MKRILVTLAIVVVSISMLGACAPMAQRGSGYKYGPQVGAAAGAAAGAIAGQIIGQDTKGTITGAAIGAGVGALGGDAVREFRRDAQQGQAQYDIAPLSPREEAYQREMLRLQRNAEIKAAREAERARQEALHIQKAQGRQQAQEDYRRYGN